MDLQVARHEGVGPNRQIRRRLNAVQPVGSSGIYPAHKGSAVDRGGSRQTRSGRLDDH
jgi:hypothetical protein